VTYVWLFYKYYPSKYTNISIYKSIFQILFLQNLSIRHVLNIKSYCTFIGPCIANIFAEHNQQDATFLNLFISVRRSTCFRRFFRPIIRSSKLHIQRQLFVRPILLPAASLARVTAVSVWQIPDTVYAVLSSWWWTEKPSKKCRASYRNK